MNKLNDKQIRTKEMTEQYAKLFDIDPLWGDAVALVESSLGLNLKSPTGARGVFGMTTIAMKDLLQFMETDILTGTVCGLLFLRLLLIRWKDFEKATEKFCDPADRGFYLNRVKEYMRSFGAE